MRSGNLNPPQCERWKQKKKMNILQRLFKIVAFLNLKEIQLPEQAKPQAAGPPDQSATVPPADMSIRRFVPNELLDRLPLMKTGEIDKLDFGCVKVSDTGVVQIYNKWESDFAGVPQNKAIGINFFRELAPCTNNRLIFGRFKDGVAAESLDAVVSYAFTYKMRPTLVDVHLFRHQDTRTNWVLVRKSEGAK